MKNDITLLDLYPVIKQTLDNGSVYKFVPNGKSMYPLFSDGEVRVTLTKAEKVEVSDIVLVKTDEDKFILHRVDKTVSAGYILRGDNLLTREGPFVSDDIVGKVVAYEKRGKEKKLSGFGYGFYMKVILPIHRYKLRILKKLRINKK